MVWGGIYQERLSFYMDANVSGNKNKGFKDLNLYIPAWHDY